MKKEFLKYAIGICIVAIATLFSCSAKAQGQVQWVKIGNVSSDWTAVGPVPVTGTVSTTGTSTVTGNWLRGDSATAQQNKLYGSQWYAGKTTPNWLSGIAVDVATGLGRFYRQDSSTVQMNKLRAALYFGPSSIGDILGNINTNTSNRAFWARQDSLTQLGNLFRSSFKIPSTNRGVFLTVEIKVYRR